MDPVSRLHAWIDLLLLANHKERKIMIRGNLVTVKRGQVGWSVRALSKRWKWSQGKVKRFIKYLVDEGQVTEHLAQNVTTLLSVVNYEKYQVAQKKRSADGAPCAKKSPKNGAGNGAPNSTITTSLSDNHKEDGENSEHKTERRRSAESKKTETNNNDINNNNTAHAHAQDVKKMSPEKMDKFNEFWGAGLIKQDKKKCIGIWSRLPLKDINLILAHIKKYVASKPEHERQYLKRPRTYLYNRTWEDEDLPDAKKSTRRKIIV
jgi:DNA replication protein DnaD